MEQNGLSEQVIMGVTKVTVLYYIKEKVCIDWVTEVIPQT